MSDGSKTAELIAEAMAVIVQGGHDTWAEDANLFSRLADALDRATRCSCPTGDGSLRWPCPEHPPTPARVPEQGEASAAIERVRELHRNAGPSQGYSSRFSGGYGTLGDCCSACGSHGEYGVEWPCPTIAALDGAPEPEWEYAWAGTDELGDDWIGDAVFDSVAEARTFFNHSTWVRTQSGELVRRRKAGPWLPVKGESKP